MNVSCQNPERAQQEMSDRDGDEAMEMEEEKGMMMREGWGEDEKMDGKEEEDDHHRGCSIHWGEEDMFVNQPASKVRRRTFFDIFEDDQSDEGELGHRDIMIIITVKVTNKPIMLELNWQITLLCLFSLYVEYKSKY